VPGEALHVRAEPEELRRLVEDGVWPVVKDVLGDVLVRGRAFRCVGDERGVPSLLRDRLVVPAVPVRDRLRRVVGERTDVRVRVGEVRTPEDHHELTLLRTYRGGQSGFGGCLDRTVPAVFAQFAWRFAGRAGHA